MGHGKGPGPLGGATPTTRPNRSQKTDAKTAHHSPGVHARNPSPKGIRARLDAYATMVVLPGRTTGTAGSLMSFFQWNP